MLTKEQKNGLIECLYSPMATLIAGFVEKPANFVLLERLVKEQDDYARGWLVWDLTYAIRKHTINKIKFETRVMAIIDAYLEGKADGNKLPASEPVLDSDEVEASRQRTKEQDRTSPAVKSALKSLLEAPVSGNTTRKMRRGNSNA